jgi:glc operon protein GlcG
MTSVREGRHGKSTTVVRDMEMADCVACSILRGKSYASAAFGGVRAERTQRANNPVMRALMHMEDGQIIPQQGAVPIKRGNELIGAIGVSGASSQEDEEIARAGLAAL